MVGTTMADAPRTPLNAGTLRSQLPPVPHNTFTRWCGTAVLLGVLASWCGAWWAGVMAGPGLLQLAAALLLGVLAGLLVILGHDAEHGSLSPWPRWNALASRLAFVPAWQPASGWTHAHRRHHAFTNLKPLDDGYPPPSPQDWRSMGRWQRAASRFALTLPGLWLLYAEVWWRAVIWVRTPAAHEHARLRADSLLVLGFVLAQAVLVWALTRLAGHSAALALLAVVTLLGVPFLLMNQLVSAITLVHHRHPRLRWFDNRDEWVRGAGPVAGTAHVVLPKWLGAALLQIFEHGAHHVDLRRPFCALPAAQRRLEQLAGEGVTVVHEHSPFTLAHLRRVMRECQLYDYRNHRWLRFDDVASGAGPQTLIDRSA